jgi:hypothetical protein
MQGIIALSEGAEEVPGGKVTPQYGGHIAAYYTDCAQTRQHEPGLETSSIQF